MNIKQAITFLKTKGYEVKLGRSTASKTLLCVSDIHDGSIYAVCSDEPVRAETGEVYKRWPHNKKLLRHWFDIRDWGRNADLVICNGEPFDGVNKKQFGLQVWTMDMGDQKVDSAKLLRPLNPKYYMFTRGSNYHVRDGQTNYEEMLAQDLNRTLPYSGYFLNNKHKIRRGRAILHEGRTRYLDNYIWFTIHGRLLNFTHHVGFSKREGFRTTSLASEMAALDHDRGYYYELNKNIAVFGRGHSHYHVEIRYPSSIGFITPSWKLPDDHLFRGGLSGTRPTIGAVKVVIEQNGDIQVDKLLLKKGYPKPYTPDLSMI